jgi:hypothetical protein
MKDHSSAAPLSERIVQNNGKNFDQVTITVVEVFSPTISG